MSAKANADTRKDVVPLLAEIFREYGFAGTSMTTITARTGLGKGSLYHFFPGGKDEMAAAVLAHVDAWFAANVFGPLERDVPDAAIAWMWRATEDYFRSGRRICLVGGFALDATRDRFAVAIDGYFRRWIAALALALVRRGDVEDAALQRAEEAVAGIQGALVLARAMDDVGVFTRHMSRAAARLGGG